MVRGRTATDGDEILHRPGELLHLLGSSWLIYSLIESLLAELYFPESDHCMIGPMSSISRSKDLS